MTRIGAAAICSALVLVQIVPHQSSAGADEEAPPTKNQVRVDFQGDPLPRGALARLGTLRLRHADPVTAMVFAPDSRTLASASGGEGSHDNTIRLWAVPGGREIRRLMGHRNGIFCLALSPDGKRLASGDKGGEIRIWDVATGQELTSFSASHHSVRSLAFAPDGQTLASGGADQNIHLWDIATAKQLRAFNGHQKDVRTVVFTADGRKLVSGGEDHTVRLWDVATGKEIRQFGERQQAKGAGTALSPDGKVIASADGGVYRWDFATGQQIGDRLGGITRTDVGGQFLAFSPDGTKLAVQGWDGWIYLWDLEKDREIYKRSGPFGIYNNLAFSPDGKLLAAGGDNAIRLWETATGQEVYGSRGAQGMIGWIGFARGGKSLVAGGWDDRPRVWDLTPDKGLLASSGRRGDALTPAPLGHSFALSPDGGTLAVAKWEKVRFVNVATGEVESGSPKDPPGCSSCLAFTPNGQQLFLVDRVGRTVFLWSRLAGREVRRFVGHVAPIRATAVSPDGRHLATASETAAGIRGQPQKDDSVRLWDVATGREQWRLPTSAWTLAFSSDGSLLAGGGRDYPIHLWDAATGKELRQFTGPRSYLYQVAFSPDDKTLASADRDGTVRLWEVLTGQERGRFLGHQGEVYALAFSSEGRRLASGGNDTSVLLWDITGLYTTDPLPPEPSNPSDFSTLWRDLGASDAALAYRALWRFVAAGNRAVVFLKAHARPVQPMPAETISRWIKDLDNDQFAVRQRAAQDLEDASELAESALRQTLEQKPSLEVRRRVERLLNTLADNQSTERLRGLRAVEVLENIVTPEARRSLKELAGGVPVARLTREAKAALERLERRDSARVWSPDMTKPSPESERVLRNRGSPHRNQHSDLWLPRQVAPLGPGVREKSEIIHISDNSKWLLIADGTPLVRLWDCRTVKPFREFRLDTGDIDLAVLSPDDKILAAGTAQRSKEKVLCLWDVPTGRELRRLPVQGAVFTLQFTPDGKQLVTGEDGRKAHLWDVATGRELREFTGTQELIWCSAISPSGKMLAIGERGAIRLYDLPTGRLLRRLNSGQQYGPGAVSLAFSPDGALLASGENGLIRFWEPASGKQVFQLEEPEMGGVFNLVFSPDGRTLATGGWEGLVRLWEMRTGQIRGTFKGHTDRRWAVTFGPDGCPVACEIGKGFVFLWAITNQAPLGNVQLAVLKPAELAALWDLLGSEKAETAYQSKWKLVAAGRQTVAFLHQQLRPIPMDFASRLDKAVAGLKSQRQEVRDAAMNELDCYGALAESALRKAMADSPTPEAQARIAYLLEKQQSDYPSGALLRSLRAIEVLEQIATPEARQLLETLSAGAPQATLTRDAKATLERLARR
jgi:WD40 repeat protein